MPIPFDPSQLTQVTEILCAVFFTVLTIALYVGGTHSKVWSVQNSELVKTYDNDLVLLAAVLPSFCLTLYYVALSFDAPWLLAGGFASLMWVRGNLILLAILLSVFLFNGRLARGLGALIHTWKAWQSSSYSLSPLFQSLWRQSARIATSTVLKRQSSPVSSKSEKPLLVSETDSPTS